MNSEAGEKTRPPRRPSPQSLCKLTAVELRIGPARRKQLRMCALLDDRALLHHEDEISVHDCGEPVRDHKARAVLHDGLHGTNDCLLGAGVHA